MQNSSEAGSKGSNKKVHVVISTLEDILQSVINEEKKEATLFNKYMDWCKSEMDALHRDLDETHQALANANGLSEAQTSHIDALKDYVRRGDKEIEEAKDAIAKAIAIRDDENEKYTEDITANTQTLKQIDLAIKHLEVAAHHGGFLQNGKVQKIQINQPGESSYVLGVMKALRDKLVKTRNKLQHDEDEKVHMHNHFLGTEGKHKKLMTSDSTEKKIMLTETSAKETGVRDKIDRLKEEFDKLLQNERKTDEKCHKAHEQWDARQSDRYEEKAALAQAIHYLKSLALGQVSSEQKAVNQHNQDADTVVFSPAFLQTKSSESSADSDSSFDAAADAAFLDHDDEVRKHLQKGAFKSVNHVVSQLIDRHLDMQKEEKAKREYCTKEIETKEDEKEDATDSLATVKAEVEKKTAELDTITDEINNLNAAQVQIKQSLASAGHIRDQEHVMFEGSSKDRALAVKVLNQAVIVLQSFYGNSTDNFLQRGMADPKPSSRAAPQKWSPGSPRKKLAAYGVVSMVRNILDDVDREQKEAEKQEHDAEAAYKELQDETQESWYDKQDDITDRVKARAKLGVHINTLKESWNEKSNDLNNINRQLHALHHDCDELLKFYDKRESTRSFEVSQLRDVMDILSGSSIAVRTGFMQP